MRIARFSVSDTIAFGVIDGEAGAEVGGAGGGDASAGTITAIAGHPFGEFELSTATFPLEDVRLLAPVVPSKIVGIGRNYRDHAAEHGHEVPPEPILFLKPSTSVIGPEDVIALPALSQQVEHEAELAVVIGRLVREVPIERALEAVLGYTCANDVTARDLQRTDDQWTRAKGFDTFCPLGPWITTDPAVLDTRIECRVNDRTTQSARTSEMVYGVAELVAYVSAVMTLLPGDVILTGTPAGVSPLSVGEIVTVSVEGIGDLANRVVGP